jgi:hypothetical protein
METIGFGYKTWLLLVLLLVYIGGNAMMMVTAFFTHYIHRLIKPHAPIVVATNSYWRRLAAAYVGPTLAPASDLSPEEIERYNAISIAGGVLSVEIFKPVNELRSTVAAHQKILENAIAVIAKAKNAGQQIDDTLSASITLVETSVAQKVSALQEYDAKMRKISADREWMTLNQALSRLNTVEPPFAAFGLISLSFMTAALGALWTMVHTGRSWGVAGTLFCVAVVVATSYQQWLIYVLSWKSRIFGTAEIADLLQKLKANPSPAIAEQKNNSELIVTEPISHSKN